MNPTEAQTAEPERPPITGEASPPPALFVAVMWMGAFSVVLWAMTRLFVRSPRGRSGADPRHPYG